MARRFGEVVFVFVFVLGGLGLDFLAGGPSSWLMMLLRGAETVSWAGCDAVVAGVSDAGCVVKGSAPLACSVLPGTNRGCRLGGVCSRTCV